MDFHEGSNPLISLPLDRPYFLAAHAAPSTPPFAFLHPFILGCIFFVAYFAHMIYCQSNRLASLEKAMITTQAGLDVVTHNFKLVEKTHRREAMMAKHNYENIASYAEEADRLAEEAAGKLEAVLQRVEVLEKEKLRAGDKKVANERRMQKQLDEITKTVNENKKALQKNYEEMTEKVEVANKRAEEAEKELSRKLEESNTARSMEREGHLASNRAAVKAAEERESRLRDEINQKEKRNLRLAKEMMERNEKRYRDDMEKMRVDHRMDLERMKKATMKREAQHAKELSQLRSEDDEKHNALLFSIAEAIAKDEEVRMEEKEKEKEARLVEKENERIVLSKMCSDISRSTISKTTGPRNAPPTRLPLQGLLTPAPSQSPPPRDVTATLPVQQAITIIERQPVSETRVKQEETSFDLQHGAVYEFLESEARLRLGTPSENVLLRTSLDQSISLSNFPRADDLLLVSPPLWSDSSLSQSPSLDDNAFRKGRILPNDSLILSRAALSSGDNLKDISPPQWPQSDSSKDVFHGHCSHSDSLSLSNMAFPSEDGILDISPPQCSLSDDLDDAFCCDRNLPNDSIALSQAALRHGDNLRQISPPQWLQTSASETDSGDAGFDVGRLVSNGSLLLSTNKAGIKIKRYSPTPSPTKIATSAGHSGSSASFRPVCTSSPFAPRTLRTTTDFDGDSFARAHHEFLPASSSWLGCHPVTSEFNGIAECNPVKQEGVDPNPIPKVIIETSHLGPEAPNSPIKSAYFPPLTSTRAVFTATSFMSPPPLRATIDKKPESKGSSKSKGRMSYGDKPRASATSKQNIRYQSLPAFVSDVFNPS